MRAAYSMKSLLSNQSCGGFMIRAWHIAVALVLLQCACATQKLTADQLARVAKDWSLSIRASQVIPVYPLTEDVQPGDVFLVQTSLEDQVSEYLKKGFLPLENLLTRLPVRGYGDFYRGWPHVTDDSMAPPRYWQFPPGNSGETDFVNGPMAGFPTYSFSVSQSQGLSVAIPVQSVPVGLNLLNSSSASGTISLKDTYTYALPARSMYDAVMEWAKANENYLDQLSKTASSDPKKQVPEHFLRVINRVYLVKNVNVTLFSNRAFGAGASAGVPGKVELLNIAEDGAKAKKQFDAVNSILDKAATDKPSTGSAPAADSPSPIAAGGTIRLAMATDRSVSLVETFKRPLVFGYLASDFRILEGGKLSAPVATFLQLEGKAVAPKQVLKYEGCDENCELIRSWVKNRSNVPQLEQWLTENANGIAIADVQTGSYASLRARIVKELIRR